MRRLCEKVVRGQLQELLSELTNMFEPGPPSLDRLERRKNRSLNDTTLKQKVVFGQTGGETSQAYPGN